MDSGDEEVDLEGVDGMLSGRSWVERVNVRK
jgi:hypothetical protein